MRFQTLPLLAVLLSRATAVALPGIAAVEKPASSIVARDADDVVVNLNSDFNNDQVLSLIDTALPQEAHRTSKVQLSWQVWKSVPGPVKSRATKTHKDNDPVIRIALAISVKHSGCSDVDGHIVFYLFPDNSERYFKGVVDSWDTLTDNWNICQGGVNDALRKVVPTKISFIQQLVDYRLSKLPSEHFPSFRMLPASGGKGDVQVVLERHTIVSRWSDMCFDVKDGSLNQGAFIQQWPCYDTNNQRWDKIPTTGEYFLLRNRNSGKYLAVQGSSSANGAYIGQWNRNPADTTFEWRSVDPGGNSVGGKWLINRRSGKCVETPNWSTTAGAILQQMDCVGGWKHYWYGL